MAYTRLIQRNKDILEYGALGWSAGRIAHELHLSRNMVLGVLHRARKKGDLPSTDVKPRRFYVNGQHTGSRNSKEYLQELRDMKNQRRREKRAKSKPAPTAPAAPPAPTAPARADATGPVHILDIGFGQCRQVVGYDENHLAFFCGKRVSGVTSWCPHHRAINFTRQGTGRQPSTSNTKWNSM